MSTNVMGIIQPPFADDEDRFDVSLIKQPPRYELLLTVKGIKWSVQKDVR